MPDLFVIMPFGTKTLPHSGEEHDFDTVYNELVRPSCARAGWNVLRIDEAPPGGNIEHQYLTELYRADLVLADISVPNGNVYYELGIRHAVSVAGTLLIALSGTIVPFDLAQQRVLFYKRGLDGYADAQSALGAALSHQEEQPVPNPIRVFLERLGLATSPEQDPASFEHELNSRVERARTVDQLVGVWYWAQQFKVLPISASLTLAQRLADHREYRTAVDVLRMATTRGAPDFEVHRQLGFYLRKLGGAEQEDEAQQEFARARELNPADPETIGMIGGFLKRQGRFAEAKAEYDLGAKLSPSN